RAWVQGHRDYWREYRQASPVLRERPPCGATAAAGGAGCKDGRVKGGFARTVRDLSAGAGECRRGFKDGGGRWNGFDINTILGSGGGLPRAGVIGAGRLRR